MGRSAEGALRIRRARDYHPLLRIGTSYCESENVDRVLFCEPQLILLRIDFVSPPQPSRLGPSAKSSLCEPIRGMDEVDLNVLADGFGTEVGFLP